MSTFEKSATVRVIDFQKIVLKFKIRPFPKKFLVFPSYRPPENLLKIFRCRHSNTILAINST